MAALAINSFSTRSIVARAASQATGFPPKVLPWLPDVQLMIFFLAMTAPKGRPEAKPLARRITSGSTLKFSMAKNFPVRPMPDWISSMTRRISCFLVNSRIFRWNSGGGTMYPPSPCMGSTKTAAISSGLISDSQRMFSMASAQKI